MRSSKPLGGLLLLIYHRVGSKCVKNTTCSQFLMCSFGSKWCFSYICSQKKRVVSPVHHITYGKDNRKKA